MPIHLYDSLERKLKPLAPSHPDGVYRFYNCGPTVYAPAHIGNFRTFVVNDVIRRLLELEHPGKVKHVRNLTDVDDKTIKRARDEGRPLAEVTKQWTDKFHADCDALNCLRPHEEPRAADPKYICEQVKMIDELIAKGNAYRTDDGSVYFKVSSFPDYGALSRVKERELKSSSGFSADADEKEDLSDFALWKAHKPDDGDVKWPGPNGAAAGRPGWHIECSAMSKALLGPTIDLHTGGVDLLFPHHENEIAQSECCNSTPEHHVQFSNHWYHSEHLLVDGKKMSKSLGNLYTLDDLKDKGFTPMALRYALLMGHPRKQLNFMLDSLHAAESALQTASAFRQKLIHESKTNAEGQTTTQETDRTVATYFWDSLNDDLNTPAAFGGLFGFIRVMGQKKLSHELAKATLEEFDRMLYALGLNPEAAAKPTIEVPGTITALAEKRWAAKQAKDWADADALRKELTAAGWSMLDGKDGYKLEPVKK